MRICLVWLRGNYFEIIERNIDAANIGLAIQPFLSGRLFGCITQNGAKRENMRPFFAVLRQTGSKMGRTPEKISFLLRILFR
jgi:hypothetical protein